MTHVHELQVTYSPKLNSVFARCMYPLCGFELNAAQIDSRLNAVGMLSADKAYSIWQIRQDDLVEPLKAYVAALAVDPDEQVNQPPDEAGE